VRAATEADAPALAGLVRRGVETYAAFMPDGWTALDHDPMFDPAHVLRQLRTPGVWAQVVEDGDGVVGFALFMPDAKGDADAYLASVFVDQRRWGEGLGRSLLAEAMAEMRRRGHRTARLSVARDYERARRTYEAAGWRPTGRESVYELDGTPLVEYRVDL
jgi:ribosomal protein S18 acetylase RimI-like enzyme